MTRGELLGHLRRQAKYDHNARVILARVKKHTPEELATQRVAAVEAYRKRCERERGPGATRA